MDVNDINPVLEAFVSVLPQIGFQSVERKEMSLSGSVMQNKGLMVNIGVVGPLRGSIVIGMDIDSAKRFASKMMMGMEVTDLDDLAQSAIAEMSNMVCANACTNFSRSGVNGLDISPPTMLIGANGQVKVAAPTVILIKCMADEIEVYLGVGLFK